MAKGLVLDIAADSRQAQKAIDDVGDALEKVGDSLDDVVKDSDRGTERMERDFREMARDVKRESRDAYDAVKKDAKEAMDTGGEAAGEFKQEAIQNFSEVTSSFDGSMSSIQDLAQGTLGGLAASLTGPLALAAGGAAAAVGLVGGALVNVQDETELSKQRASEWAEKFVEAGGRVLTAAQNTAEGLDIINNRQDELQKNAKDWGVSAEVATAAMTGQQWALDAVAESLAGMDAEYQKALKTAQDNPEGLIGPAASKLENQRASVAAGTEALRKLNGEMDAGAQQADTYSRFLASMAEHTAGATKEVDEFGDTIYTLPDETKIYVDAETGQATQDVDAIERKIYGLPDANLKVNLDTSAADAQLEKWRSNQRRVLEVKLQAMDRQGRPIP